MKYYVIRDLLVGYGDLVGAPNEEVATRRFKQIMNSPSFKENKKDYQLFYVGEFDEHTGEFKTEKESPIYITGGGDV